MQTFYSNQLYTDRTAVDGRKIRCDTVLTVRNRTVKEGTKITNGTATVKTLTQSRERAKPLSPDRAADTDTYCSYLCNSLLSNPREIIYVCLSHSRSLRRFNPIHAVAGGEFLHLLATCSCCLLISRIFPPSLPPPFVFSVVPVALGYFKYLYSKYAR